MKEIEEWFYDCKFIYFSFNLDIEPTNKINEFRIIAESEIPKIPNKYISGFYGYVEKGISYCWLDLINCNIIMTDYDHSIIPSVFEFNRTDWIKNKRKKKLENIINNV